MATIRASSCAATTTHRASSFLCHAAANYFTQCQTANHAPLRPISPGRMLAKLLASDRQGRRIMAEQKRTAPAGDQKPGSPNHAECKAMSDGIIAGFNEYVSQLQH